MSKDPFRPSLLTALISTPAVSSPTTSIFSQRALFCLLGVCLAYFESKFNPSAVYENPQDGSTGFGLFQIRDNEWCDHGKNLCSVSCTGGSLGAQQPAEPTCLEETGGRNWLCLELTSGRWSASLTGE